MSRFAIAFYSDVQGVQQVLIEAPNADEALRQFFDKHVADYTKNSEGFTYFREDFFDADKPLGAITPIES